VLFLVNPLNPISKLKVLLLRMFGAKVGKGVVIKPSVNIKYPWLLEIGDYTWIGEHVWIDNLAKVKIGANCCLSQGAMLLCGNHNYKLETFDLIVKAITLEDGAWVGAMSTVCPGVTLKSHAILTVDSVATETLEAYSLYKGNPAVKIRDRKIVSSFQND
jgi:putative colanic acid biosynthesis acetyltransferase WcaF